MPKYQDNQYRSDTSSNSSHSFYQSYVNQIALNSREIVNARTLQKFVYSVHGITSLKKIIKYKMYV